MSQALGWAGYGPSFGRHIGGRQRLRARAKNLEGEVGIGFGLGAEIGVIEIASFLLATTAGEDEMDEVVDRYWAGVDDSIPVAPRRRILELALS